MQLFEKTLGDFLEYWAEKTPDKEFIVYSDRDLRFTYSEFNRRVNNLAKGMMAIGVEKDSKVGIWATNVPDWLTFLVCFCQDRCNSGYCKYKLQAT